MHVTPQEVRSVWESRVRCLLGVDDYTVSAKKWDAVFERTARLVSERQLNLRRYVDAQLEWAIHTNRRGIIWPNLLEGERAMNRYLSLPSESQTLNDLREYYLAQATAFTRVCETLSEDQALNNNLLDHSPLFLAYVWWKTGRQVEPDLIERARRELEVRPQARQLFDLMYIGWLEGG